MKITLQTCASGRITVQNQRGEWTPVNPCPCFPWSRAGTFISLRDDDDNELAFIEDISSLSEADQTRVKNVLGSGQFTFEITKIHSIERDFELRVWKVDTNRGPRKLQTMLDEFPHILDDGKILITDLAGDIYEIKDRTALDKASQKKLWAFTD